VHNDAAARAVGARDALFLAGEGRPIEEAGSFVGLWDVGAPFGAHRELDGKVEVLDRTLRSNHATHVAGTITARGADPLARGMAPGVRLRSYDWHLHATELREAAREGLLLSNHSYGRVAGWHAIRISNGTDVWYWFGDPNASPVEDAAFGYYDLDAALFDAVTFEFPSLLPVIAAGNDRDDRGPAAGSYLALDASRTWQSFDIGTRPIGFDGDAGGFDSMAGFALAKNVLTVGSVGPGPDGQYDLPSVFSSFGPADDGRIKPDLVAPGENLYSPIASGPADYATSSGTSMAAPTVTGSLALLQNVSIETRGEPLRAASLKGLVLHTALDIGLAGPDYASGWGRLDVAAAGRQLVDSRHHPHALFEAELAPGERRLIDVAVDTEGPIRVSLCWTDRPGEPMATTTPAWLDNHAPMLGRDLDLRVIRPDLGILLEPYVLDPDNPELPAGLGDNRVDPFEQISIAWVPAGIYTIDVSRKPDPVDSLPVPFTLMVSGARENRDPVAVEGTTLEVASTDVRLAWATRFERFAGAFELERAAVDDRKAGDTLDLSFHAVSRTPDGFAATGATYHIADRVPAPGTYLYRLHFVEPRTRTRVRVAEWRVEVQPPDRLEVVSVYPNPFDDAATVAIDVPETQRVRVRVVDVLGREAVWLLDRVLTAGRHDVPFAGETLPAGVYYIVVEGEAASEVRALVHRP
jgi:hypothetical protein